MVRWLLALAAIGFAPAAVAAELDALRGSTALSYTVAQTPPPFPVPIAPPPPAGPPPVLAGPPVAVVPPPAVWNWTGFYLGANAGLAVATSNFANPFGASVFGDRVRSPGFMAGGQIGFNWQAPGARWVLGVEADADAIASDGTSTCYATSGLTINSTCRVRPQSVATLTGRVGYATSVFDELQNIAPIGPLPFRSATLIYGKAGVAYANDKIDMAINNAEAGLRARTSRRTAPMRRSGAGPWGWASNKPCRPHGR
jgi:opacity protein-like surface antigen